MEMRRNNRYQWHAVLLLFTLLIYSSRGEAKLSDRYNKQKPLVVVCDWELPPYEFFADNGTPEGYTIDLMDEILDGLDIPHTFVLKENPQVIKLFKEHKADLLIGPAFLFEGGDCYSSSNVLNYYKVKAVTRANAPVVHSINGLKSNAKVVLRKNGIIAIYGIKDIGSLNVQYHAPMEALAGVSSGKYDYFIWGEEPLKWKIKELNIDSLRIDDLELPVAELRIGGHDKELIDAVDDYYARLEQKGELDVIRDKWFHPERHHDNTSPVYLYIALAALALLPFLFLLNRLIGRKVRKMTQKNSEQTRLMNMAIEMGGYMITEYNPRRDTFKNIRGNMIDERMTMSDVISTIHPDDLDAFNANVEELKERETNSSELLFRRTLGKGSHSREQYLMGNCIKERNEKGHTVFLLVAKDITKDMEEEAENNELALKFIKAFDSALMAMAFYDKDGYLLDLNRQMKNVIGVNAKNLQYFHETRLFDAPLFRGVLSEGMTDTVHACQHMFYPEMGLDKYLEYRVRPVFNEADEVRYYAVTVRDVTVERNLYSEQLTIEQQLKLTNSEVNMFEQQMNYLLSNYDMYIWRTNFQTETIEVTRSLHSEGIAISFEDYMSGLAPEEVEQVKTIFFNPLMRGRSIHLTQHYLKSPLTKRESWFAVSGTPLFNERRLGTGHFGIIREITHLVKSQEELRRETLRAEQSGALKATFLANMTHEIRTPLNAIVGFSDLLHMAGTTEERTEFIHIIRHNCDLLLRLVDDILETSDMNDNPQRFEAEELDFPKFFDELCQTVAQRIQEPSVSFIKDNPYESLQVQTDKERIQQVVTNFVTNSVKYTHEGHIKVGYSCTQNPENPQDPQEGLYIYCEDTGVGIPKEKQASVFDRFVKLNDYVQGTGLGLSICKSIAERCGGSIGVMSEGEGKGSTFWIWVPRYLTLGNLSEEK